MSRYAEHLGRGARSRSECPFEPDTAAKARNFVDDFISVRSIPVRSFPEPLLEMSNRDLLDGESADAVHPAGAPTANVLDKTFISSTAYELLSCTGALLKLHEVVSEPSHEALVSSSSTGLPVILGWHDDRLRTQEGETLQLCDRRSCDGHAMVGIKVVGDPACNVATRRCH